MGGREIAHRGHHGGQVIGRGTAAAAHYRDAEFGDVAPVKLDKDGGVRPGNLRESIRHAGPTIVLPANAGLPVSAGS